MKLSRAIFALIGVAVVAGFSAPSSVSSSGTDGSLILPASSSRTSKRLPKRANFCRKDVGTCISLITGRLVRSLQDELQAEQKPSAETYALEVQKSEFLQQIAIKNGLSPHAMITLCQVGGECRHLHGKERLDSPASLIKIPIALVLLHKADVEKLSLNTKEFVSPDNFTEDRSDIGIGEELTLKILLKDMIADSSNIATNQLIDYLGWDYMNRTLHELGYQSTEINFKVVGEEIFPANPGEVANRLTSDELTQIMIDTYSLKYPGAEFLVDALRLQSDRDLGYAALQGTRAQWLGEKTGQTSDVLGTTVAMRINDKDYILTVIDDNSAGVEGIRDCINQIAKYIYERGDL
jgi:beta-lactamase class A